MTSKQLAHRKQQMQALREKGYTLQSIGERFNISRERVRQIINNAGYKRRQPIIMTFRRTCYICREPLNIDKNEYKFCTHCRKYNKIDKGRERVRGIVRGRDNNTCQACGKVWDGKSKRLDVHHLKGKCGLKTRDYDSPNTIHDLITVCHKCHYNLHDHQAYGDHNGDNHTIHL